MTYQLVIWCRYGVDIDYSHIYTTLFKSNYKILFEIWIAVKSNMISYNGCHGTNSKHPKHDYVCCVTTYLCAKYDINGLSNFWIIDVSVFSQSEALICSVGASPDSDSMGESESESGLESGLGLYPCGLGLGLGLHLCGLGLKRCGLGLWSYGLGLGLGLHPGGLGLTVSPGESGEKCTRQI